MRKRVLHILNTSSYSGAENVVINIIKCLPLDYECAYVSMDGAIRRILEKNEIEFLPVKKVTINEMRRVVALFNPDIIHAHDYTTSIICALSRLKAPIISHLHNNSPWIKSLHPYSFIYWLSTINYRKVITVSESILDEYVFGRFIRNKAVVMQNPIDKNSIISKSIQNNRDYKGNFDIVFLGRMSEAKNPIRFIKIISNLREKLPNISVAIIGDGELLEECKKMVVKLGLENVITFTGFLENPYSLLAKSKVLCMTSKWEGFGLAAVEALCLGIPVVGTTVGGLVELINDKCGLLTEDDEDYINEVVKLITDEEYWNIKANNAKIRSLIFDSKNEYIDNLINTYNQI